MYLLKDFKAEYIMDCLNNNKTRQSKKMGERFKDIQMAKSHTGWLTITSD